ncbi:dymeclin [Ostrinia nubilalis]|uniref:dymeclin n=1 Tax=Ostrinia nubilalis TaxID=29057 RepID=UPI0030825B7E
MGVAVSKYSELTANELLARFCSSEVICANDPFWNQMLAFNINPPANAEEQLMFDASTEPLLQKFLQNNPQTGNLGSLVQVFVTRATELLAAPNSDNVMLAWQTFNALFVTRAVTKYLVEMVPEYELCRHLDEPPKMRNTGLDTPPKSEQSPEVQTSPKMNGSESKVEVLIDALIGLIIDVPVTDNTYYLHLECINTLLVLMSVYMFAGVHGQARLVETSLIFRTLFQGRYGMHAPLLVKTLLGNLAAMLPAPPAMFGTGANGGSVLINIASGLWNMLTFNTTTRQTIYSHPPLDRSSLSGRLKQQHPLSNQSCLLLLALANHCIADANLYRAALLSSAPAPPGETTVTRLAPCVLVTSRGAHFAWQSIYSHPPLDRSSLSGRLKQQHPLSNQSCLLLLALANHCIADANLYRAALLSSAPAPPGETTVTRLAPCVLSIYSHPPLDRSSLSGRLKQQHPLSNQSCLLLLALANHCIADANLYRAALLSSAPAPPGETTVTRLAPCVLSIYSHPPLDRSSLSGRLKQQHPLSNQSCLLLLALANHCIADANLYRAALLSSAPAPPGETTVTRLAPCVLSIYSHPPLDRSSLSGRLKQQHPLSNQSCLLLLALANHCIADANLYRAALLSSAPAPPGETTVTRLAPCVLSIYSHPPLDRSSLSGRLKQQHPLSNQSCLLLLALANHCIADANLYRAALLSSAPAPPGETTVTRLAPCVLSIYSHPPLDRSSLSGRLKQQHPLSNQSCLLLLALANHCIADANLYRAALLSSAPAPPGETTVTRLAPCVLSIYSHPPLDRSSLSGRLKQQHPLSNQSCLLLLALANHCIADANLYRAALLSSAPAPPGETTVTRLAPCVLSLSVTRDLSHFAWQSIYSHPPLDRSSLSGRLKQQHPLSNQSCLLLLALANHCIADANLYRAALLSSAPAPPDTAQTPQKDSNGPDVTPPRIDMAALHKALCATAGCEHSTLLLYVMLHSCDAYKRYVSQVTQIDELIIPILQVLYNAPESSSHHIYMSLIVLLILTEDDALIKNVHLIMLKNLTWYTERSISEISLGGLMVLVIVRALQYNMARVRDKYLHTNCLAAIANMSCEFRNLHPYVAQRLISLFETLTKRRARLCSEIEGGDINNLELPHHAEEKTEEVMDHINVLDEVLRMLLEIINSCLTHQLSNNLNVVYALLHKKQLFEQHRHHNITQNIEMVIGYFSTRLQRVQEGAGGDLGVTEVLACIKKGAEQWSSDRLKKFPDLKFRYVEEERPEEFFTPYVWGLITSCGGVYWASECGARAVTDLLAC